MGSPQPHQDTDIASNVVVSTGSSNITNGRCKSTSNSTILHDTFSNNSPDISENISTSLSPVKTSRENSMSDVNSDDQSSYIDLKHRVEYVDLEAPESQKFAIKYLLNKVQHNESLVIAVAKEYKTLTEDLNKLHHLNDNLAAENVTLKDVIETQKVNIEKLTSTLAEETKSFHNELDAEAKHTKENFFKINELLSEEIAMLKDEIFTVKTTCNEDKDGISNALITDLSEIKTWLEEEVKDIRSCKLEKVETVAEKGTDLGTIREINATKQTMLNSIKMFQEQIQIMREEVKESLHRSSCNQIRIENINIEHSDEVEQLVTKMVELEIEIQKTNQYGRRPNLVIDGIPDRVPQHHLEGICLEIIQKLGINNVTRLEVEGCHRLRKREGDRNSPTIIRFTNRKISELCKRNKWKLKKLRYNNWFLTFREDLNEANSEIYSKCEQLKSIGRLARVYTHNGFTKVVKNEGEWPKKIFHMKELFDLFPVDVETEISPNIVNLNNVGDVQAWLKETGNVYVGRGDANNNIPTSIYCNDHKIQGEVTRTVALNRFEADVMKNDKLRDDIKMNLKGKTLGCFCSPQRCHAEILHRIAGNRPVYQKTNKHRGVTSSIH